jgi:hypothetical protein
MVAILDCQDVPIQVSSVVKCKELKNYTSGGIFGNKFAMNDKNVTASVALKTNSNLGISSLILALTTWTSLMMVDAFAQVKLRISRTRGFCAAISVIEDRSSTFNNVKAPSG